MTELDLTRDAIEITKRICDVPSVSGDERQLADLIERALRRLPHLEVVRDGDAIVARTHLGRGQRVIIAGHIDTVPIKANVPSWFEDRDGEQWLVGRGTVDMKAGVAVQLRLAAELTHPVVDITWVFYDNEEVDSSLNGMGRLAHRHPELLEADFAILGEPTAAEIEGGCNGTTRFVLRTRGVRAHSARSWVGKNAIHDLQGILEILNRFQPESIEVEGLVYREGLNAVTVHGGVAGNVIPDLVEVMVNYRFAPSRTVAEVEATMTALFAGYEIEFVDMSPGARPGLDQPVAAEFISAIGATPKPKYGWTDVARFSALGIPAVNYGPGDPLKAHADDEALPTAQITQCVAGLRRWLSGDPGLS